MNFFKALSWVVLAGMLWLRDAIWFMRGFYEAMAALSVFS
jgi:hypothetical protein